MSFEAELLNLTHPSAEATVLAAMRDDEELAIPLVQAVDPECFSAPQHRLMFEAIQHILRGTEPVDVRGIVEVGNAIAAERKAKERLTPEFVAEVRGDAKRALAYASTLKRYSWLRGMGDLAFWLVGKLQSAPNPDELFSEAQERLQTLQAHRRETGFVYGWDTEKFHEQAIAKRLTDQQNGQAVRFDFPWESWNAVARWLRPGMVGSIYGPTKAGKSIYFDMIAEHWATKCHVVLVHLEDDLEYKLDRRIARHARIEGNKIEDGALTEYEQRQMREARQRIGNTFGMNLHYLHAPGWSMSEIVRELETRHAEGVCDAVVLDYLDKVQPSRAQERRFGSNGWERQADDMEQVKSFAERTSTVVFTGGQGTKEMQDATELNQRFIAGSGQKLHKSQLNMMFLRRRAGMSGAYDAKGEEIAKPGELLPVIDIGVVSQNRGSTGIWQQQIFGKYFAIQDIKVERVQL